MSLTITTWNVQNLSRSSNLYTEKLNYLTRILQILNPDIIALQEILDVDALQDLAQALGFFSFDALPDYRYNRVTFLTRQQPAQAPRQINQWRLPPGAVIHRFNSDGDVEVLPQFSRPAFQITVEYNGQEIDIITAHLKSKLLKFGNDFTTSNESLRAQSAFFALELRAAEATTLREHVTNLLAANRDVVLLGDLNDGPEAATTQILYGEPLSQPRGPEDATSAGSAFQRADEYDAQRLFNVTKLLPENIRWTRLYNGQKELLDHILASQGLMPRVDRLRQVPEMSIINDDMPNMIGAHPIDEDVIPDHAPVTATFV